MAEELFQKLTGGTISESVHLLDWPEIGHINELVLTDMAELRELINQGLSKRAIAGLKVRQPLAKAQLMPEKAFQENHITAFTEIAQEELNVKQVILSHGHQNSGAGLRIELDMDLTPELKREGLVREVIRGIQNARKQTGLSVEDRIVLSLIADDQELTTAINEHIELIKAETLATSVSLEILAEGSTQEIKIDGKLLAIGLSRA